ncbi:MULTISPECIES: hypothetical protein [Microbacterium]|uniref:hypothetical protein n=1 Tax=Microbacterium TaxID=33882 RepID=UPI000835DD1D|nr:hypothetical protein [Microbacterium resistens]MBW1638848.1 hypothetical protein [Microbacterium resistens]MDA4892213.1 hypothetical protein [Streptomyces sp. MS2A]
MTSAEQTTPAVPRTAVPHGIVDPVASARAELKAALAAIEVKGNLPRRMEKAITRESARLRQEARTNPVKVTLIVVGAAVAVGGVVWGVARLLSR